MHTYEVLFAKSARKDLERLSIKMAEKILDKIERLSFDPRPTGCEKL